MPVLTSQGLPGRPFLLVLLCVQFQSREYTCKGVKRLRFRVWKQTIKCLCTSLSETSWDTLHAPSWQSPRNTVRERKVGVMYQGLQKKSRRKGFFLSQLCQPFHIALKWWQLHVTFLWHIFSGPLLVWIPSFPRQLWSKSRCHIYPKGTRVTRLIKYYPLRITLWSNPSPWIQGCKAPASSQICLLYTSPSPRD